MPGRFLEIPVFLGDNFFMPHPVDMNIWNNYDTDRQTHTDTHTHTHTLAHIAYNSS